MGLEVVQLVLAVEEDFEIVVPDREAEKMLTVGAMHSFVVTELRRLGRTGIDPVEVFDRLKALIVEELGVEPSQVTPEARFVADLGIE